METNETKRRVKTPGDVKFNNVDESDEIWKPDRFNLAIAELNEDDKKTVIFCRSVMSLLNKLTPENYPTLSEKLKNLSIDTSVRMHQVVEIVHRKAIQEWKYNVIYAKVCDDIRDIQVVNELGIEKSFSLYLISHCETYFVNNLCDDFRLDREKNKIIRCFEKKNKISSLKDLEQNEYEFRRNSVGNCQFIGELFKVFLIHPKIIFIILDRLFKANGDVAVECICAILSTIQPFYEERVGEFPVEYLNELESSMSNDNLSQRTRFRIQDILDLKKRYWHPRRLPELPKTIRQLDQEMVLSQSMSHLASVLKKSKTKEIKFHSEWTNISMIYFEEPYESSGSKQEKKRNPILNPTGKAHTFEGAVCNILENLTANNLKSFSKAIKKLPINDSSRLECIAELIFQYAMNKPDKCKLYAEMCRSSQNLSVPDKKHIPPDPTVLKTLIVTRCQQEFDTGEALELVEHKNESQQKSVSNCRFIGELFNVEILHVINVLRCVEKLIQSKGEESLKCLHELLTVAGKNLISKLKQLHRKKEEKELLDKLQNLLVNEKHYLSPEVKSVLEDLIDMKENNESVTCEGIITSALTAGEPDPFQLPVGNLAPKQSSECPDEKQVEKEMSTKITISFENEVDHILDMLSYNDFIPFELIKKLRICNSNQLQYLVDSIYRKAIEEPCFCKWCADMCHEAQSCCVFDKNGQRQTFRTLLINKCQQQFEGDKAKDFDVMKKQEEINACTDPEMKKELQSSFNECERVFHRKKVGNCRLIGELSNRKILTTKIILRCITKLFESTDDLSLECLCTLLTITKEDVEYKLQDNSSALKALDSLFEKKQVVLDGRKHKVSSRIRFMFRDIANNSGSYKYFKNYLSDLRPEDFDSCIEEIDNLQIESASRLRDVVDYVFNTAINRVGFHRLYAKVCSVMLYKTVLDKDHDKILTFKKLLIEKCQQQSELDEVEKFNGSETPKETDSIADPTERNARQECLRISLNYRRFLEELCELVPDFGKHFKLKKDTQTAKGELDRSKGEVKIAPSPNQSSSEIAFSSRSKKITRASCIQSEPSEILKIVFKQWKPNEQFSNLLESIKCTSSSRKLPKAIAELINYVMKTDPSKAKMCGEFFVHMIEHGYIQCETVIAGLSFFLSTVENQLTISSSLDLIMTPLFESGFLKLDDLNKIFGNNSTTKSTENQESDSSNKCLPRGQIENNSNPKQTSPHMEVIKVSYVESFFDPFSAFKNSNISTISSTSNSVVRDPKNDDPMPEKIQQLIRDTLEKHTRGEFSRSEFKRAMEKIPFQKANELKFVAQCIIQIVLDKPELFVFCAKLCRPIALLTAEKKRFWMQLINVCNKYFYGVYFNEDLSNKEKPFPLVIRKGEIAEENMKGFCRFFAFVVNGLNNETANVTSQRIMQKLIEVGEIDVFCEIYEHLNWSNDRFEKSLFESCIPHYLSSQKLETGLRERLQRTIENYAKNELELQSKTGKKRKNKGDISKLVTTDIVEGGAERPLSSSSGDKSENTKSQHVNAIQIVKMNEVSKKLNGSSTFSNEQITDAVNEVLVELLSYPDKLDMLALRLCNMRIEKESKLTQVVRVICRTAMMNSAKAKLCVKLCERIRNWKFYDMKKGNVVKFRDRVILHLRNYRGSAALQLEIKEYKDRAESDENFRNVPEKIIGYCRLLREFLKSSVFGFEFFIKDIIELLILDPLNEDAIELLDEFLHILRNDLDVKLMNLEKQLMSSSVRVKQLSDKLEKYNVMFKITTFLQEIINFQKRKWEWSDVGSCTNNNTDSARETNKTAENRSVVYNKRLNFYLKTNPTVVGKTIKHFEGLCENSARFLNSIVVSMCRAFLEEWKKEETVRNFDKEFSSYALLFKIFSQNIPSFGFHCTNALFDCVRNSYFPPGMMSKMLEAFYLYEIMTPESLVRFKNVFLSNKISDVLDIIKSPEFEEYKLCRV